MKAARLHTAFAAILVGGSIGSPVHADLSDVYWSPTSLTNVVMWLDATDLSTVQTNASGQVHQWDDKTTNGNDVAQGNATLRPLVGSYDINGLNAIRSDGSDDYMRNSSVAIGGSGSAAMFAVAEVINADNGGDGLFSLTPGFELRAGSSSQFNPQYFPNYINFGAAPHEGPSIYEVAVSTNAGNAWGYVDGVERLDTTNIQDPTSSTDVSVFAKRGGIAFAGWLECDVGEVILLKADVTTATRQLIEGYLAWKWELETSLPPGHPYENAPPGKPSNGMFFIVR